MLQKQNTQLLKRSQTNVQKGQLLSFEKRFDTFLNKIYVTDYCWEWKGTKNKAGYGVHTWENQKLWLAHRLMWHILFGEIVSPKTCCCHVCDNPGCVRPSHLFLGTYFDNTQDKLRKDRQTRGEKHALSILKDEDIPVIRQLYKDGLSQEEIGHLYGRHRMTISNILTKTTWSHIQGE